MRSEREISLLNKLKKKVTLRYRIFRMSNTTSNLLALQDAELEYNNVFSNIVNTETRYEKNL